MPFSKRTFTWSEEVFAGVVILALIVVGVALWWFREQPINNVEQPTAETSAILFTEEEKIRIANELSSGPVNISEEEKIRVAEENKSTPSNFTLEEKIRIAENPPPDPSLPQ